MHASNRRAAPSKRRWIVTHGICLLSRFSKTPHDSLRRQCCGALLMATSSTIFQIRTSTSGDTNLFGMSMLDIENKYNQRAARLNEASTTMMSTTGKDNYSNLIVGHMLCHQ